MKISLENYLRNKLDEVESMHSFELATDTIRCWIDEYNEQLRQYNVVRQSEQLICVYCGVNPMGGNCPYPKKCSTKKKIKAN